MDISKIDISKNLSETEYALRSIIKQILGKKFGENWIRACGINQGTIDKWTYYKENEKNELGRSIEDDLFFYSSLKDLRDILKNNWDDFKTIFTQREKLLFWIKELIPFRNAKAHVREPTPYQKCRIIGCCGEIRSEIAKFKNMDDKKENYFPRIEQIRDNLNNKIEQSNSSFEMRPPLTVGTDLTFEVTAIDPLGGELEYGLSISGSQQTWQTSNILQIQLSEKHRGRCQIEIKIRSSRDYRYYHNQWDDLGVFVYTVIPK